MHDEDGQLTDARWLRIRAKEWRAFAASARDPFVREIFLWLVEIAEAEIATGSKSDLPTIS
jgi:hypothetical protein